MNMQNQHRVTKLKRNGKLSWYGYSSMSLRKVDLLMKLGEIEDYEDLLGIDIVTLMTMLRRGRLFCKDKSGAIGIVVGNLFLYWSNKEGCWMILINSNSQWANGNMSTHLKLKDYGKTFAFTEEELKEEKQ